MGETKKHIDELVATRTRKQAELLANGREIAASAKPIVVAFVDLAESTEMKQDREPEEWLGNVFEFVQNVDQRARDAGGTVVKRIGDELMVTFKDVQSSERFVASLIIDTVLRKYRYKIAVDWGSAYHFCFIKSLPDDPYGLVVDRCARIAKYAGAGTAICTSEYRSQLGSPASYVSMGSFALRGLREPEELFIRSLIEADSEEYLKPLVSAVNEEGQRVRGYRLVGRKLTTAFIRDFEDGRVRPFLARELLNIPKLPYLPREFGEIMRGAANVEERESASVSDTLSSGKARSRALHAITARSPSVCRSVVPVSLTHTSLFFCFCHSAISKSSMPCEKVSVYVRVA